MANFLITYVFWWYLSIQSARSQIDRMVKLKLRFSKCTVIMGRDHGHPYILSTTVLSDTKLVIGMAMVLSIIQYIMKIQVSLSICG